MMMNLGMRCKLLTHLLTCCHQSFLGMPLLARELLLKHSQATDLYTGNVQSNGMLALRLLINLLHTILCLWTLKLQDAAEWRRTVLDELKAMEDNEVWKLVPLTPGRWAIGSCSTTPLMYR